jgi:hypothetical protein
VICRDDFESKECHQPHQLFARLKADRKKAFIAFITVGDPCLDRRYCAAAPTRRARRAAAPAAPPALAARRRAPSGPPRRPATRRAAESWHDSFASRRPHNLKSDG